MSCEVKTFGNIRHFHRVQEYFGLGHDENWMNAVNYAVSPTGELIALAQGEKLAFLSSCWNNKNQNTTYALSWCGELENPNEIVTTIICLPIFGKEVSSGPEWTCVALGLNSGMVLFYTDAGIKIFSQSYDDNPVLSIKSYSPPPHSELDSYLFIIYDQCVCIIKGVDIFPLLSNQRHNITRTMARVSVSTNTGVETADTTTYQKFNFARERETLVNDGVVIGSQTPCSYDHVVDQCLGSGYFSRYSSCPIQRALVLGIGAEPYLGFYYAEEGYRTISLKAVAKDVIGVAYKNILGNLFGRPQAESPTENLPSPSKESQMRARCRFFDGKRDGFTIAIAPGNRLAAITDNLHRVMLVDCERAVILRVWKGYRDAQCAFVPVKEQSLKGVQTARRKALFLVIYAPRIGCLEIWALQNGPRVAAFTVSKSGQLAYNTHGLLGAPPGYKAKIPVNSCLFIDPSDGSLKEISIPFHFALSESNSKTSRDIHLLKRLKTLLRDSSQSENTEDIIKLASEFQTIEVRKQCLQMITKSKQLKPAIFRAIVYTFAEILEADNSENVKENQNFKNILENYKRLVDFYITMSEPIETEFDDELELHDCDLVTINQLVLLLGKKSIPKKNSSVALVGRVTFQEQCKDDGDFIDYLSIFNVEDADKLSLNREKSEMFGYVSGNLFGDFFNHGLCFDQFKEAAQKVKMLYEDLLVLTLHFWIKKPFTYTNCDEVISDMSRLAAMVKAICELAGDRVNSHAYNAISPWWQAIREMLLESPKSLGLLVAIVCKTVATNLRRSSYRDGSCDEGSQTEEEERWEKINHDEAQWGLLIGKLEDISVLGAILEFPIKSLHPEMPELPYVQPDCSLKTIVSSGKGVVTDLTAQWLIHSCIHPSKILELEIANTQETEKDEVQENEVRKDHVLESKNIETDPVLQKLSLLREHFPFSLESGVLLSLMSWQYMVHWSKNLQSLRFMRASLDCLHAFKESDHALKHGICCLLWNATLKYPLQSTTKLIQKVGRLPTEKMCQQDIEMSSSVVVEFLELVLEFMRHFSSSLNHVKRELKFEESLTDGQLPLQFIALQQHHAMKELLQLHTELYTVLHFIAFFQIKFPKPVTTLFDAMSNKAFLADVNKELNYVLPAPDQVLQKLRENFLCKVITASMDLIREDLEQLYVVEHMEYMQKICDLANSWKLNMSGLKRQQVVEMYAFGYDEHGEVLLKDILDDEHVGNLLLEIAGRRLNLYSQSSSEIYLKIASIGPQLLKYLDNLKETTNNFCLRISASEPEEIDIVALSKLVTHVFEFLARHESKDIHIAAQMFDACCVLQE